VVPPGTETGPAWVTIAGVNALSQNFTINTSAQITDSLGRSSSYTSVMLGGTWLGSDAQGSGCSRCTVRGTIHNDYDSVGRLTATTDELLLVTNLAYDAVPGIDIQPLPKTWRRHGRCRTRCGSAVTGSQREWQPLSSRHPAIWNVP
jgi:hypothetical protein